MESQYTSNTSAQAKTTAKDFFLNLGAIVALYTVVVSLLNLLFTVINTAYPKIAYSYYGSQSISFPVSTLIIFFPIFVLLMWLLERGYMTEPEKKHLGVRRWLTYITLFIAGLTLAVDLVTVLYYFIDGQELTLGFFLKALSVLVVILMVFMYYISDIRNKLTSMSRKVWAGVAIVLILASVVWGFMVLGSPRTQQLIKYDGQKISDLQNISGAVNNYYQLKNSLPSALTDLSATNYYFVQTDGQTGKAYEYSKTGANTYEICAEFNKDTKDASNVQVQTYPYMYGASYWNHPAGRYCFSQTVTPSVNSYPAKPVY